MAKSSEQAPVGDDLPADADLVLVQRSMDLLSAAMDQGRGNKRLEQLLEFANKNLERIEKRHKDDRLARSYQVGLVALCFLFCFSMLLWYGQNQVAGDIAKVAVGGIAGWLAAGSQKTRRVDK